MIPLGSFLARDKWYKVQKDYESHFYLYLIRN